MEKTLKRFVLHFLKLYLALRHIAKKPNKTEVLTSLIFIRLNQANLLIIFTFFNFALFTYHFILLNKIQLIIVSQVFDELQKFYLQSQCCIAKTFLKSP